MPGFSCPFVRLFYRFDLCLVEFTLPLLDSLTLKFDTISTNVPLNLLFWGFCLCLLLFWVLRVDMPSSWGNATDEGASRSGSIGIFFMALTLAIVFFFVYRSHPGSLLAGSLSAEGGALQLTAGMTGFGGLGFALCAVCFVP